LSFNIILHIDIFIHLAECTGAQLK